MLFGGFTLQGSEDHFVLSVNSYQKIDFFITQATKPIEEDNVGMIGGRIQCGVYLGQVKLGFIGER